jgi:hypothetical protein
MILESRKWRLWLLAALLLVTSWLIIGWAGPASFALQQAEPAPIVSADQLTQDALNGRFATVEGAPDLGRVVAVHQGGVTSYWVPLTGFADRLFVTTTDTAWQTATVHPVQRFTGKIVHLSDAPDYDGFKRLVTPAHVPPSEAYVLLEGEQPDTYRPMVPMVATLIGLWLVGAVGFVRVWRRRQPRGYRA